MRRIILVFGWLALVSHSFAQKTERTPPEQCGTMPRLELKFQRNPQLKSAFEKERARFNEALKQGMIRISSALSSRIASGTANDPAIYTIPIVFHIVLSDPNSVSDAQIQAQLDTLNKDYAGGNGDSVNIPSWFKPLFGKSTIRFCLARRTPDGESTTGIERITTSHASYSSTDEGVKHASSGGADSWDNASYYNVWICPLSGGVLGYATFPEDGQADEQGVVIDYRSIPGGSYSGYNKGKTLSHETGHYFNLYHIWGDDDGACTGTDYVDDTPNQANSTSGCYTGVKTDACTTGGNGIMYQNYMDYSNDDCLIMFTTDQVIRMESALITYRSSLLTSLGCQPPVQTDYDIALLSITQPAQRICVPSVAPVITVKNLGRQTITTLAIRAKIDQDSAVITSWTGSLAYLATVTITLNTLATTQGSHSLSIATSLPDGQADQYNANDTASIGFQYYEPVTTISEDFEKDTFPPTGWDIVNPDRSITWQRVTGVSKTGSASAMIDNYEYSTTGQQDDLRLPDLAIPSSVDSAFLTFQVAASSYSSTLFSDNIWDTLQVLVSTDCGNTYTSLYKKYGSTLVTSSAPTTSAFVPASTEWRKDSVNLDAYIGQGPVLIAFRNTTGYENNVYLDDIGLHTVTVNPNLKKQGFLLTPNPATGIVKAQFYPGPTNLRGIEIYSVTGQLMLGTKITGQANSQYSFDLTPYAKGTYFVRAVFSDKVLIRKLLKR